MYQRVNFDLTFISAPTKAVVASNPIISRPEATAATL